MTEEWLPGEEFLTFIFMRNWYAYDTLFRLLEKYFRIKKQNKER